jgi:hypothetical protein
MQIDLSKNKNCIDPPYRLPGEFLPHGTQTALIRIIEETHGFR